MLDKLKKYLNSINLDYQEMSYQENKKEIKYLVIDRLDLEIYQDDKNILTFDNGNEFFYCNILSEAKKEIQKYL